MPKQMLDGRDEAGTPDPAAILSETQRILSSSSFRSSKRSQEVLTYLVKHAIQGNTDSLKERVIGREVFGRPLDYDTGQDSIVRGKVNEVRKRLAQYFDEAGETAVVRIDIPVGSYVPEFHELRPRPAAQALGRGVRLGGAVLGAAVVLALVAFAIQTAVRSRALTPYEAFWQPFLDSSRSVTLCVAHPQVYSIYGPQVDELLLAHRPGSVPADASKNPIERRPLVAIIPEAYNFVGVGDAYAIGYLYGIFRSRGKGVQIRRGNDMAFAELRSAPSVLIGGFTNQWSESLLKELRFVPRRIRPHLAIFDQSEGKDVAVLDAPLASGPNNYVDYAVVSRLIRSRTGEPLVGVVGVSHYGTMAAGELVSDEAQWGRMLAGVPGWTAGRNLQVILRVNVIMRTPEKVEVVTSHVW